MPQTSTASSLTTQAHPTPNLNSSSFSNALGAATHARTSLSSLLVFSAIAVAGATKNANAQWFHNAADLNRSTSYGAQKLEGIAVWYSGKLNNGQPYIANGTLFDSTTIIGAAHRTPSPTSTATIEWVGTSLNYNQPERGQVRRAVRWLRHPDYAGVTGENDLSKIIVDVPFDLTQYPNRPNGPLRISTIGIGEPMIIGGYAPSGSPDTGLFAADGQLRGGNMLSTPNVSPGFPGLLTGLFSLNSIDLNATGTVGLSGGTGISPSGDFLGVVVAGTANPQNFGYTYLTPAAQYSSFIPEPSSVGMMAAAVAGLAVRRRQ